MSGEDDDDDIWNSDNFIATIEVFLQKAEHESAVKHGTQPVVPSATSDFPDTSHSTYNNGLSSKFGPSYADTKLSYGSSAPHAGNFGRVGDFPKVGPEIRANEFAGGTPILQPLNYHNPWTGPEVRDVYASQPSKGLVHDQSGNLRLAVQENESPALRDILAEKDGAISLLRTRLREAEQQVDEFRRRVNSQTSLQPAISQQRELERLSSQLLFKEQEVNEAQMARLEKEEQLKNALAEAAALREELQRLNQSRSTGGDGSKRSRDEGASPQEDIVEGQALTSSRPYTSTENNGGISERQHDPWASPWLAERTPRKILLGAQEKNATELSNRLPASDASFAVVTLKNRIAENGCVSSTIKNELNQREKSKAVELNKRESTAQFKETESAAGMSEVSYSLQQIWGFKGAKNEGKALVAKIYASCAKDLYLLLSNGETKRLVDGRKVERRKTDTLTISEKFHSAIAKVANGSAHPEIILGPLLEFCNLDSAKLLGSALRVLHCILQHDDNCRQRLMGSKKESRDPQSSLPVISHAEEKYNVEEAKCGFKVVTKMLVDGESKQVPVFSSPRIFLSNKRGETSTPGVASKRDTLDQVKQDVGPGISNSNEQQIQDVQQTYVGSRGNVSSVEGTSETKDLSAEIGGNTRSEKPKSTDQQQHTDQYNASGGTNSCDVELHPFLKWMVHLALTSTSSVVRLEAVAIIGVLVVHSEPLVRRLEFGPLLNHEGLETLLKESAGVEIQLQAVRIVHHLLHCPTLYRTFCTSFKEERTGVPNSKHEFCDGTKLNVEEPIVVEGNNLCNTINLQVEAPVVVEGCASGPSPGLMKRKLMAGLAECLKYTGTSLQGYALRRNVMRLITYIASCGDVGVAFLMQPLASYKSGADESTRTCKDDSKADAMALGESASGQHIAGNGSGFRGLDARVVPATDDLEAGLPNSREDLENVMNIPERLVTLLGAELESQDEGESEASLVEERACLTREVATLLSCLASHPVQSGVVIGFLISNPRIARLTLRVINDLVSRKSLSQASGTGQKHAGLTNSETTELCKSLRRRVMRALAEAAEP